MQTEKVNDRPAEKTPGEVVMKYRHDSSSDWGIEFTVARLPDESGANESGARYEASIPQRGVFYPGRTPEEAFGHLLLGMMQLARAGSIDPNKPALHGVPPIQHVIQVLSERLAWQIENRRARLEHTSEHLPAPSDDIAHQATLAGIAKDNDVISALATSIAALARVKDL